MLPYVFGFVIGAVAGAATILLFQFGTGICI
jgi:gas vesicle protein